MHDLAQILPPVSRPSQGIKSTAAPTAEQGWAMLPHALAGDPRLTAIDIRVIAALLYYARKQTWCTPCDQSIAARVGGVSAGTIQRSLRRLDGLGIIRREAVEPTDQNRTARVLHLLWRDDIDSQDIRTPVLPVQTPNHQRRTPRSPARDKEIVIVERENLRSEQGQRSRPSSDAASHTNIAACSHAVEIQPAPLPTSDQGANSTLATTIPAPPVQPRPVQVPPDATRGPVPPPAPSFGPPATTEPMIPPAVSSKAADHTNMAACSHAAPRAPAPATLLTPEEQARLNAMDPGVRDQILTWLMLGDPILMREAKAKLVPPRPRPEAPRTLPEVLGRIREDPSFPAMAADWLSSAFGDRKSYSGFLARCTEAWRGELPVERLVAAYDQASGPRVKNQGAVFMTVVKYRE